MLGRESHQGVFPPVGSPASTTWFCGSWRGWPSARCGGFVPGEVWGEVGIPWSWNGGAVGALGVWSGTWAGVLPGAAVSPHVAMLVFELAGWDKVGVLSPVLGGVFPLCFSSSGFAVGRSVGQSAFLGFVLLHEVGDDFVVGGGAQPATPH